MTESQYEKGLNYSMTQDKMHVPTEGQTMHNFQAVERDYA